MRRLNGITPIYDDEAHTYTYEGQELPSVTRIVAIAAPMPWMAPEQLERARQRGKDVHLLTQLYDEDDLDLESVDPELMPYLEAWQTFLANTGFKAGEIEKMVAHPRHRYAGTFDRVGTMPRAGKTLVDIKSGAPVPGTALQTAGYAEAYNVTVPVAERIKSRLAVHLKGDGSYLALRYRDTTDISVFLNALGVLKWKEKHSR